ncbi:uncharacterized protein LOC131673673 isoform X3 [Phymastichus coffea]|uniref:uncharacterized protein LOC131673673 isoform X3 n=1 Tax=Phymastichus coffea TaxID=108790 RepID=UPI00273CABE8|nr:uncharacterized protein LOC131673673 isoform X3 [Phymastichus coffea]
MTSRCPAMRSLLCGCCCFLLLLLNVPTSSFALPLSSPAHSRGTNDSFQHSEANWLKISLGLLSTTITAFTLIGCLCCHRNRRPKGFEDCTGSVNKEFKDGNSIDNDASLPQLQGLELQVPAVIASERVQFEPLPIERFVPEICVTPRPKIPAAVAGLGDESESEHSTLQDSCQEWFQKTDLHVSRDKLKYLREIGHGWFGKVVEGCADLQDSRLIKGSAKTSNVIVRILTEEATAKEKAWFLGEATPYFKLRHRNILSLFGSCLETDPYLLLFESCPLGDLKSFLKSNRESEKTLIKENLPTRIAIEVGAGLRHMHEHGLAHTDLSARNCLMASDLSIKLGDYGMGVEKYPGDYYILGNRALPIRWSAPESVECTDTTIETREITPRANLWSYAVLLWEIATWGERPYNELEDEKVIEMLLSSKSGMKSVGSQLLLQNCDNCASNLVEAIKTCLVLEPEKRLALEKVRHILLKDQLESETSDFEQRWEILRPNVSNTQTRSASLQDLRGSLDSEQWPSLTQTSFRLGPEEPVKNVPGNLLRPRWPFRDSDSETEEESWRGRVERGAYTEKVKQKSKSVADLMVLVHIEPDSDADMSLGPPVPLGDKMKKRISMTGSDGDLPSAVFDHQFNHALRKLRDPLIPNNSVRGLKSTGAERPKLLTLMMDQGQYPIVRLASEVKAEHVKEETLQKTVAKHITQETSIHKLPRENLFHLVKDNQSLLHYETEIIMKESQMAVSEEELEVPVGVQVTDLDEDINDTRQTNEINKRADVENNLVDMNSWSNALEITLEKKTNTIFTSTTSPISKLEATNDDIITPSPQSRAEYSAEDAEDEYSNAEDLPGLSKRHLPMDDEDDRKRMSTPDDERSSDSGFRDKESCEEEESPLPGLPPNLVIASSQPNTPRSIVNVAHDSAEEEQMRILFELDTILDAECYGTLGDSLEPSIGRIVLQEPPGISTTIVAHKEVDQENEISETKQSSSEATGETEKEIIHLEKSSSDDINISCDAILDSQHIDSDYGPVDSAHRAALLNEDLNSSAQVISESSSWPCLVSLDNNEDEDSSTMSLRSDNSYIPFNMDDEFVAAIRNELREKLPHAQMSVVEAPELRDDDEPSLVSDVDSKNWEDDLEDELTDRTGIIDIAIRYNTFGTPLSPILEERESASNSESINLTRDDVSIASKGDSNTISEDDVLLIDVQTNRATLVEAGSTHSQESQELSNRELSDDNNLAEMNPSNHQNQHHNPSYLMDRRSSSGSGAPLPSPEDEACKWQQMSSFPTLPPQLQENLMSTSFTSEQDWDSEEELPSENAINEVDDDDDDDEDEGEDGVMDDDDEEDTSSSSGEFVWQQYGATAHLKSLETESPMKAETKKSETTFEVEERRENDEDLGSDDEEDDDEEEEEFTPSAWDATLAPHRSALRSPDKTTKSGDEADQKKSVWFKKQRYHCVYEYPKETPPTENQSPTIAGWEPTSYTDWEEMIDNIDRLNFQPMDYFETNNTRGDEEFYVSSSNRPFQFQSGNGKFVSQFFPGASGSGSSTALPEAPSQQQKNEETSLPQPPPVLGELRHTRDRLKLNLTSSSPATLSSNGSNNRVAQLCNPVKQGILDDDEANENEARDEENNLKPEDTKVDDECSNKPLVKTSPSEEQCTSEPKSNDLDADLA